MEAHPSTSEAWTNRGFTLLYFNEVPLLLELWLIGKKCRHKMMLGEVWGGLDVQFLPSIEFFSFFILQDHCIGGLKSIFHQSMLLSTWLVAGNCWSLDRLSSELDLCRNNH